jgi:hypothetical protein
MHLTDACIARCWFFVLSNPAALQGRGGVWCFFWTRAVTTGRSMVQHTASGSSYACISCVDSAAMVDLGIMHLLGTLVSGEQQMPECLSNW